MKTPPKTDEGKNGTVAESKPLTKLREKLKDKEWDLNLTFKDGAVVKETDEKRQEVRKSDASFETKGIIEANLELTEQNKASKKEMLSIKSGELLDDLLK